MQTVPQPVTDAVFVSKKPSNIIRILKILLILLVLACVATLLIGLYQSRDQVSSLEEASVSASRPSAKQQKNLKVLPVVEEKLPPVAASSPSSAAHRDVAALPAPGVAQKPPLKQSLVSSDKAGTQPKKTQKSIVSSGYVKPAEQHFSPPPLPIVRATPALPQGNSYKEIKLGEWVCVVHLAGGQYTAGQPVAVTFRPTQAACDEWERGTVRPRYMDSTK